MKYYLQTVQDARLSPAKDSSQALMYYGFPSGCPVFSALRPTRVQNRQVVITRQIITAADGWRVFDITDTNDRLLKNNHGLCVLLLLL